MIEGKSKKAEKFKDEKVDDFNRLLKIRGSIKEEKKEEEKQGDPAQLQRKGISESKKKKNNRELAVIYKTCANFCIELILLIFNFMRNGKNEKKKNEDSNI